MRILLCSLEAPFPPSNGLRLQVAALTRELSPRHDVRVLAFVRPDQRPDRAAAVGMRLLDPPPGARGLRKIETNARSLIARRPRGVEEVVHALREPLADEIERFDPDVVHATMGHLAAFPAQLAGRATV